MPWSRVVTSDRFDIWQHTAIAAALSTLTDAIDVAAYDIINFQTVWAAHADTSTLQLQASIDLTNWDNVTGSAVTTAAAAGSNFAITQPTLFRQIRFRVSEADGAAAATHTVFFIGRIMK